MSMCRVDEEEGRKETQANSTKAKRSYGADGHGAF